MLIVDDSAFTRKMLRRSLEALGHAVVEAESGPAALDLYAKERPDVVTLDLLMPDMGGLEVMDRLKTPSASPVGTNGWRCRLAVSQERSLAFLCRNFIHT